MTDPDPYHDLKALHRDHLFAAAWYAADHDELPNGRQVSDAVETRTGHRPDKNTTSEATRALADAGLVERIDATPATLVRVTDDGRRALARGAARLDAAATVEADA